MSTEIILKFNIEIRTFDQLYEQLQPQNISNLRSGDSTLVDQKSLNVVEKIEVSSNFEVEKYVIIYEDELN